MGQSHVEAQTQITEEFANYFLPVQYRGLDPSQIPHSVIAESRRLVEAAMASVYSRLTVPIVTNSKEKAKLIRYFPFIKSELKKIDPDVKVLPSGGVVRFVLTYLYDEARKMELTGQQSAQDVLKKIAYSDQFDIQAANMRGVGGDLDVFLISKNHFLSLKNRLLEITNSAEAEYGFTGSDHEAKRAFFTVGDSKDYNEQTQRSTNQGGSTIDFLAYDLDTARVLDTPRFPNIFNDLLRGLLEYAAPFSASSIEDPDKQTIRGIRTLVEIPWAQFKDESVLRLELENLTQSVLRGKIPSSKALEQFGKALRNSRYGGVHNCFYNNEAGSIYRVVKLLLDALASKTNVNYFPQFVESRDLKKRNNFREMPASLLMPQAEFIEKHTADGVIYHGTKKMDHALSILRQGLIVSSNRQGLAAYGRGAYASKFIEVANQYASEEGLILKLKVSNKQALRIIDWSQVANTPFMLEVQRQSLAAQRDTFEFLSIEYGIDIIINNHVLIQNSEAIEFPNGLRQILEGMQIKLLEALRGNGILFFRDLNETFRLINYAQDAGLVDTVFIVDFTKKLTEASLSVSKIEDFLSICSYMDMLKAIDPISSNTFFNDQRVLLKAINSVQANQILTHGILTLLKYRESLNPIVQKPLAELAKRGVLKAGEVLGRHRTNDPQVLHLLAEGLTIGDGAAAAAALKGQSLFDEIVLKSVLSAAANNSKRAIQINALEILLTAPSPSTEIIIAILKVLNDQGIRSGYQLEDENRESRMRSKGERPLPSKAYVTYKLGLEFLDSIDLTVHPLALEAMVDIYFNPPSSGELRNRLRNRLYGLSDTTGSLKNIGLLIIRADSARRHPSERTEFENQISALKDQIRLISGLRLSIKKCRELFLNQ